MTVVMIKRLVIFAVLCSIANCLMKESTFNTIIRNRCYNKTHNNIDYLLNGQNIPLPNSMETFINLLERFERNFTKYSAMDIAEIFLRRFRIDGMTQVLNVMSNEYSFDKPDNERGRERIIEEILFKSQSSRNDEFPEEAFTEDEKCALYYMMSHMNIDCAKTGIKPIQSIHGHNGDYCFVEQGVVSLNNNEIHAIAIGRVLLGILAGMKGLGDTTGGQILYPNGIPSNIDDKKKEMLIQPITPIFAVTVGDVVVEEMLRVLVSNDSSRKFGPNGVWNSTICQTRYYLDTTRKPTKATYAELRGAGDGLLLGLVSQELESTGTKVTISSMLRMYYSMRGLIIPGKSDKYSYCDRYNLWKRSDLDQQITQQIHNYARMINVKRPLSSKDDSELHRAVSDAMREFENSRNEITGDKLSRCSDFETDPCEKVANIFAVIDNRANEEEIGYKQKEILSELATYLDIGLYGGSMSVMSTARGFGDKQLENIVYNTTVKGCIGCTMDWFVSQGRTEDESYVFQSINKTLMNYEEETAALPGVPVKVLIYFNYAEQPARDDKNLRTALWEVHNKHRDVPIFAIGKSNDLLKKFATDDSKVLITEDSIVEVLNTEICETFSTLQYPQCWEKKSSMDDFVAYEGYVTPNYVQYWAMYPEYFLKSFNIKFSFSAEGGHISVCYSRDSRKDILKKNCQETTGTGTERIVEFTMSNPCKGKNVYSCKPFYFSIKGKDADTGRICKEKECKYLDQIKFKVRHQGVSCNSSSSLVASLQAIVAILVLFCIVRKNV